VESHETGPHIGGVAGAGETSGSGEGGAGGTGTA
jgi:hypothetical protein